MLGYPLLTFNSGLSNINGFTFHSHYYVQSRLDIDKAHPPTQEACWNVMQSAVWQECYRLKRKYFNGVPANQIRMTSPVSSMNDAHSGVNLSRFGLVLRMNPSISCLVLLWSTYVVV